jgi:uncharacterized protein YcbK (DUF882 family)
MGETRSRRAVIRYGISAALCLGAFPAQSAILAKPAILTKSRQLAFTNLHTGESWNDEYWSNGRYEPQALSAIRHVLRDHRTNESHVIDTRLLDLLVNLRRSLDTNQRIEVISGYRSPETNAMLAAETDGVAASSLHMDGMAIDIRIPGRRLRNLRDAALHLSDGGVGYYPHSNFVHVDVGRVRKW